MKVYKVKAGLIPGSNYKEVNRKVQELFYEIRKKTKRKPYVRSVYFNKQKIFFDYFWVHITQKSFSERVRRLRFFGAGIELIRESKHNPYTTQSPEKEIEVFHRFYGVTQNNEYFTVQIKDNKKTGAKQLMSIFPIKNPPPG